MRDIIKERNLYIQFFFFFYFFRGDTRSTLTGTHTPVTHTHSVSHTQSVTHTHSSDAHTATTVSDTCTHTHVQKRQPRHHRRQSERHTVRHIRKATLGASVAFAFSFRLLCLYTIFHHRRRRRCRRQWAVSVSVSQSWPVSAYTKCSRDTLPKSASLELRVHF